MLVEIFQSLSDEIKSHLENRKPGSKKLRIRIGNGKKDNKTTVRIELLRFGVDMQHVNFVQGTLSDKIYYAFTFFITVDGNNAEQTLELIENIAAFVEKKPFFQLKITQKEYELGISPLEAPLSDINQFWIAQQQKHQPVLFYQARISEV